MRSFQEDGVELWRQLSVLVAEVGNALDKKLTRAAGVGLTDFLSLQALCTGDPEGMRIQELADALGLTQSSATRAVHRLAERGLAERTSCPNDGRGVLVRITGSGLELVERVRGPFGADVQDALAQAALDARTSSAAACLRPPLPEPAEPEAD